MGTLRWKLVIVMAACLILPLGGIGFGQEAKTSAESAPERFGMSLREQLESMRWESWETQDLFDVLSSREVAALYRIKALPNPCSRKELLECGSAAVDEVRQVIDIAIAAQIAKSAEKQAARSEEQNRYSRLFALGGLCISCLSLLLSALSYRQKAKAATS
jgi:hypothetical protein